MNFSPFVFVAGGALCIAVALVRPSAAQENASPADRSSIALEKMIADANRHGGRAAYVFDLDETIVDSSPRRYESMLDAIDEACAHSAAPHPDCQALRFIRLADLYRLRNRYDDRTYLRQYGARDEAFIEAVSRRAFAIYLSGRYIVDKDRLYLGAQRFIRALKRAGAQVDFVSSRSLEHQALPTRRFLEDHGLLRAGEERFLHLKPDGEASADFKRRATREIAERVAREGAHVFGVFENEPENLEIWVESFPRAMAFFMVGAYQHEGPVARKAVILEDFRYPRRPSALRTAPSFLSAP
jgi:phosphoglycolate phosphatase-like HAD superfamily hydrolase